MDGSTSSGSGSVDFRSDRFAGVAVQGLAAVLALCTFLTAADAGPILDDPVLRDVLEVPESASAGVDKLKQAVTAFREGRLDDALATFEAAGKANPDLPPPRLMLARLLFAGGDAARGRGLLEQVAAERADLPAVYLLFGQLALAEGRVSDAALNFDKAAALAGGVNLSTKEAANLDAGTAAVAEARGDWKSAETSLASWLKRQPEAADARLRLARALVSQNKPDAAAAALASGKQAKSEGRSAPVPPPILIGRLLDEAGKREEARTWMTRGLKEHPNDATAYAAVAGWHLDAGEPEAAQKLLSAVEKLDPNLDGLGLFRGRLALALGDSKAAEKEFEALHRASPADADVSDALSRALLSQADLAKRRRAVELAEVNARQYPNSAAAAATLGRAYFAVGRLDDAQRALTAAAQGSPLSPDGAYALARVLSARGKSADARTVVEQALAAPGPFPERKDAEAWLRTLPPAAKSTGDTTSGPPSAGDPDAP